MTARDIAERVRQRRRYIPPRRSAPIDAAQINSRVSNRAYRSRFTRTDGHIGLNS
jgi:hypothetical protein